MRDNFASTKSQKWCRFLIFVANAWLRVKTQGNPCNVLFTAAEITAAAQVLPLILFVLHVFKNMEGNYEVYKCTLNTPFKLRSLF